MTKGLNKLIAYVINFQEYISVSHTLDAVLFLWTTERWKFICYTRLPLANWQNLLYV